MPANNRDRWVFSVLLIMTIALGLASRRFGDELPQFIARYAGDTLWATAVFFGLAVLSPRSRPGALAAAAFTIAVLVECSQLLHTTWLDAVRSTRVGALILGHGFLWSDLACYAIGVALGVSADEGERRLKGARPT